MAERDSKRRAGTRRAELDSIERREQMRQTGMMDRLRVGAEINELKNMASRAQTDARELESLRAFQQQFPPGQGPAGLDQRIQELQGGAAGLMGEVQSRAQAMGATLDDLQDSPEGLVAQGHALDAEIKDAETQLSEARKLKGRARMLAMRQSRDRLLDLRRRSASVRERAGHLRNAQDESAARTAEAKAETLRVRRARRFVEEQLKLRGMAVKDLTESEREAVASAVMAGDDKGALRLVKEAISMRDKPKPLTPEEQVSEARLEGRLSAERRDSQELTEQNLLGERWRSIFTPPADGGGDAPAGGEAESTGEPAVKFDAGATLEQAELVSGRVQDPEKAAEIVAEIERVQSGLGKRLPPALIEQLIRRATGAS